MIAGNAVIHFGFISHIDGETKARHDIDFSWQLQLNGTDAMSKIQAPVSLYDVKVGFYITQSKRDFCFLSTIVGLLWQDEFD